MTEYYEATHSPALLVNPYSETEYLRVFLLNCGQIKKTAFPFCRIKLRKQTNNSHWQVTVRDHQTDFMTLPQIFRFGLV